MRGLTIGVIITVLFILIGCSGGGSDPITPSGDDRNSVPGVTGQQLPDVGGSNRILWGYWEVSVDSQTGEIDLVAQRGALFNGNVAHFLAPPYSPVNLLSFQILPGSDFSNGFLNLRVRLSHPFLGLPEYKGFDVRTIFIADGTSVSDHDPAIQYSSPENNEAYMVNPDGFTRWWNPPEFTDPLPLLSYKPFASGTLPYPSASLNPYKYFADDLGFEDDVGNLPPETRGIFRNSTTPNERNFKIQFPVVDGNPVFLFNIAIDASWEEPDPSGAPDYPVESFPPGAQCQEAYHVSVTTSESDVWYDDGDSGGSVRLAIEVFEWQSIVNPGGVAAEINAIWIESPIIDTPVNVLPLAMVSPGSQTTSSIFEVELGQEYLGVPGVGNYRLLGSVESANPNSYQPQIPGGEVFIYPDGPLAAWFMGQITVEPPDTDALHVIQPNGDEVWDNGTSQEILWSGGLGTENISIIYSKDDFAGDINPIVGATPNDGSYTWDPVPDDPSTTVKVRISDTLFPGIFDDSDDYFTIVGTPLEIVTPNGGELWVIGDSYDIEWTGGTGVSTVDLTYSKDDFVSDFHVIAAGVTNTGSYMWDPIPNDPSDTVKVRVEDASDPVNYDDSDDYFTIADECLFNLAPTYDHYVDTQAVMGTGFDFLHSNPDYLVGGLAEAGGSGLWPWMAVYEEDNYTPPLDTFMVPGWVYPNRPWCYKADSNDRIYFFMGDGLYTIGDRGPTYTRIYYIDWIGTEFNEASFGYFDIDSYVDSGEHGVRLLVDSADDVYCLTDEGKVIKFDHLNSYSGTELFDLDGAPGYPTALELGFAYAEDEDVFFIYTEYGSKNRAVYKVSDTGTILDSDTNIFTGIVGSCGSSTGGIAVDGDCRLIIMDGSAMSAFACIRYNYNLDQKAYTTYQIMNHPGNTIYFKDDGTILFNAFFWQWMSWLLTYDVPADW